MPWEVGPRQELVELVSSGRLRPGRAVDLGCGTGANAVFLAQHGFEVTGIDFAPAALAKATAKAATAGVQVRFLEDDLTRLRRRLGTFEGHRQTLDPRGRRQPTKHLGRPCAWDTRWP